MRINITFLFLLSILLTAGSFGIYQIIDNHSNPSSNINSVKTLSEKTLVTTNDQFKLTNSNETIELTTENSAEKLQKILYELEALLVAGKYINAVSLVNKHYSQLSSTQLQQLRNSFLAQANLLTDERAIDLLVAYNNEYNDLDVWAKLSQLYIKTKQWSLAIESLLSEVSSEYRPEKIAILNNNLIAVASHAHSELENRKDEVGINQLYQYLNESLPDNTRFQLELANSYLRLNNTEQARYLLEVLQFDLELGEVAKNTLTRLNEDLQNNSEKISDKPTLTSNRNEIVIPLQRAGNSFFVNTEINRRKTNLLLDTGASITALSNSLIQKLGLKPIQPTAFVLHDFIMLIEYH